MGRNASWSVQLHRSPGVIFEEDEEKKISSYGKNLYFARMIPYRGAWVEFEYRFEQRALCAPRQTQKTAGDRALARAGTGSPMKISCGCFMTSRNRSKVDGADEALVGRVLGGGCGRSRPPGKFFSKPIARLTREAFAQLACEKGA